MLGINEEKLEVYPKDGYETSAAPAASSSSTGAVGMGMAGLGITAVSAVATMRLPWRRQRSASYPISTIVACDIVDKRSPSDRLVFVDLLFLES